jgi:hypothetical protein
VENVVIKLQNQRKREREMIDQRTWREGAGREKGKTNSFGRDQDCDSSREQASKVGDAKRARLVVDGFEGSGHLHLEGGNLRGHRDARAVLLEILETYHGT